MTGQTGESVKDANEALQTLADAEALPSQHGAEPLEDSIGVVDGQVLTVAELAALPPDQQDEARDALVSLATSPGGLGAYVKQQSLESAYTSAFGDLFSDGEPGE